MRIKSFETTPAISCALKFDTSKNIHLIRGRPSEITLDLLREMICDSAVQCKHTGELAIYGELEIEYKHYNVCCITNANNRCGKRLAVNFVERSTVYSVEDTEEYIEKCLAYDQDEHNIFKYSSEYEGNDSFFSESDRCIHSFNAFVNNAKQRTSQGDRRPVFIFGFLERIDEAVDISAFVDELLTLGRQIFISVVGKYPENKIDNPLVQVINAEYVFNEAWEECAIGERADNNFTVIACPVCGHKTLDNHWICNHCLWENDGFPEDHYSAANGTTLAEYRCKYKKQWRKVR